MNLSGATFDFDSRYGTETRAWAGYGQVDWSGIERLTLSAGARYTRERKDLDRVFGFRTNSALPYFYHLPEGYRAPGETFTDTSPMASVAWRATDWLNTYARYAEGFKSGGYNGEFSNIQGTTDRQRTAAHPVYSADLLWPGRHRCGGEGSG